MALFMYQAAYASESWAAQLKNTKNRVESVGRVMCESVGGRLIGGWLCFGEYDLVIIADVPDSKSMAALALAVGAGGAIKSSKTTPLLSGDDGVSAMKKAAAISPSYSPPG